MNMSQHNLDSIEIRNYLVKVTLNMNIIILTILVDIDGVQFN